MDLPPLTEGWFTCALTASHHRVSTHYRRGHIVNISSVAGVEAYAGGREGGGECE